MFLHLLLYFTIDVDGHAELDNLNVSGVSTFVGITTNQSTLFAKQLNVSGVSTFSGNVRLSGVSTFVGITNVNWVAKQLNVSLEFSDDIHLGDHDILVLVLIYKIYHNSNNSYISHIGYGDLNITGDDIIICECKDGEDKAKFITDGAVELYYDNSKKFETTGIGVSVSNGAGLTATIAGPSNLIIDPGTVGDNTGTVRIKGDLFVDGTQTQINSTSLNLQTL